MKKVMLFLGFYCLLSFEVYSCDNAISCSKIIAINALQTNTIRFKNSNREVLVTGGFQYRHIWARDFAFSVRGALSAGKHKAVRDTLEKFFFFQNEDGLLPRLLDDRSFQLRIFWGILGHSLPLTENLKPNYVTEHKVIAIDSNLLLPWAAYQYVEATNDLEFAERYYSIAISALENVTKLYSENDLMVKQPPFSDWEDSLAKTGSVAITQVNYMMALRALRDWSSLLQKWDEQDLFAEKLTRAKAQFEKVFWDEERGIYRVFAGDKKYFSAAANFLPISEGFVSLEKSRRAMQVLEQTPLLTDYAGRATWPNYPLSFKNKIVRLVGIPGYHDEIYWLHVATLAARSFLMIGEKEKAIGITEKWARKIVAEKKIYEVYEWTKKGKFTAVKRAMFRAEEPFTWSSTEWLFLLSILDP